MKCVDYFFLSSVLTLPKTLPGSTVESNIVWGCATGFEFVTVGPYSPNFPRPLNTKKRSISGRKKTAATTNWAGREGGKKCVSHRILLEAQYLLFQGFGFVHRSLYFRRIIFHFCVDSPQNPAWIHGRIQYCRGLRYTGVGNSWTLFSQFSHAPKRFH